MARTKRRDRFFCPFVSRWLFLRAFNFEKTAFQRVNQ
jgi:hypothetical protein